LRHIAIEYFIIVSDIDWLLSMLHFGFR
jgi:hypothetical protein